MGSNLPVQNSHCEPLYRQTYNTYGNIVVAGLTQDNRVGNDQKKYNSRLNDKTNKGILAGSVVAIAGEQLIGPCVGDSTLVFDKAVGIAVNDAVGNPYESSSAVGSGKVVYMHGTGTVFSTDIYETRDAIGSSPISYTAGDLLYASQNGLLTNLSGLGNGFAALPYSTLIGIVLKAPAPSTDPFMTVQMKI